MAGYVNAVPAFVCFWLPAWEASSFCDFLKLTSCDFIAFISSWIEVNFYILDVLIKEQFTYSVSKYNSCWCFGFQWATLWRSDKFLLTLSVVCQSVLSFLMYRKNTVISELNYMNVFFLLLALLHTFHAYNTIHVHVHCRKQNNYNFVGSFTKHEYKTLITKCDVKYSILHTLT